MELPHLDDKYEMKMVTVTEGGKEYTVVFGPLVLSNSQPETTECYPLYSDLSAGVSW